MIYMEKGPLGTIELDGKTEEIIRWEVWFLTIRGYHMTLAEALKDAEAVEMPAELIRPVSVAISGNLYEPVHKG